MNSEILKAIPILPSSDVRASIDFYVQKLGFTDAFSHGEPANYAGVSRDGAMVHLCQMDDAKAIAAQTMLRFHVQNLDALYGTNILGTHESKEIKMNEEKRAPDDK